MNDRISPQLKTQNLLSMRVDSMSLDELQEHLTLLRMALIDLITLVASTLLSGPARYQLHWLIKRVSAQLDIVCFLIEDRKQLEALEVEASRVTGAAKQCARQSPLL